MHHDLPASAGDCSFSELQFDSICQQFIRDWGTPAHVAVEQLIAENCDLPRAELLARLLEQEFRLRRASGEQPELSVYIQRFNDEEAVIRAWNAAYLVVEARDLPPTSNLTGGEERTARIPDCVGHFSIRRLLGRGSFGVVYLAHDPSSHEDVAIKVPRRSAIKSTRELEDFLQEAQTGEHLDHPNLVRTLRVQEADGRPVIVQQFIDGQNLTQWCEQSTPTPEQLARLLVPVAEALGYLHQRGVFHRDLKPGNILVDRNDRAYVADFGLALHETQQRNRDRRGELAGTLAYMAPEQFLGESQLIDGQSDIWSFGVILYRLLTDRYPFGGPPPLSLAEQSDYIRDLKFEIREHDPRPPRQINPAISRRLEQICMRCLEKRKRDRYQTAYDLAEDLRLFLDLATGSVAQKTPNHRVHIVPKGLRSFDDEDAAFFLDLLPGPRTLEGIPTSLSFWKSRLIGTKGDVPIEVGVVYGPSGCGKSSFTKAGLLPLLGDTYVSLFVESTPLDTEIRVLSAIRRALPELPQGISLIEACHWVAEGKLGRDRKVLLILDQFEQWLYAHPNPAEEVLAKALLSCNGTSLQVLLLVRDDFWMPLTRFMERLEIPLQEGNNAAAIDLFDSGHARTVLVALGQAYGRLPIDDQLMTPAQQLFVSSAVEGLADDHRVYCVRLTLFAEMMKDRPWTPVELARVGGAKGIGVAFLEEKFGPNGPLAYRPHLGTIRRVLAALLPPYGSTMKGQMKTVAELQESSGGESETALKRLLHSLDTDLRLLTPVVVDDTSPTGNVKTSSDGLGYQLTHDYLVPSIREWLTRKQRETLRGRCELRLEERASLWSARPEPKQLPTLWETLQITLITKSANWTAAQSKLMQQAQRRHGRRLALVAAVLMLFLLSGMAWHRRNVEASQRRNASELLERLLLADIDRVPQVLREMKPTYGLWRDELRRIADDGDRPVEDRLRAELALVPQDRAKLESLLEHASTSDLQTLEVVRGWLIAELAPSPANELWRHVQKESKSPPERLRLAVLLAEFDTQSTARWNGISSDVTEALLNDSESAKWVDQLLPIGRHLTPALATAFLASQPHSLPRQTAAQALAKLGGTETLCRVLIDADDSQIELFVGVLSQDQEQAVRYLHPILAQSVSDPSLRLQHISRQRATCLALIFLGRDDLVWPQLESAADPSLRTELILSLNTNTRTLESLLRAEETVRDAVARQAIWLAMGGTADKLPPDQMRKVAERLSSRLTTVDSIAERAAMTWLARQCETSTMLEKASPVPGSRGSDWFVNSQGTTFAEFHGPVQFLMGSLDDDPRRDGNEVSHVRRIERDFAVSVHEVTVSEYRLFQPGYSPDPQVGPTSECPASSISWLDAARYCRWLSEQEHVPENQMCYPPVDEIQDNMSFATNLLERTGYRLPTEAEWEFVCRGGTTSRYFFGENEQRSNRFAWTLVNSGEVTWPVGQLWPNAFGLFDIQGNVHEWCQDAWEPYPVTGNLVTASAAETNALNESDRVIRGAMYRSGFRPLRSAFRQAYAAPTKFSTLGFRLARTISDTDD